MVTKKNTECTLTKGVLEPLLSGEVYSLPLLTNVFVSLIIANANGPVCTIGQ